MKWRQVKKKRRESKTWWYEAGFSSCRGLASLLGLISLDACSEKQAGFSLLRDGFSKSYACTNTVGSSYVENEKWQCRLINKSKWALCSSTCGGLSVSCLQLTYPVLSTEPAVGPRRAAGQWGPLAAAEAHACTGPILWEEQDKFLQRKFIQLINTPVLSQPSS